MIFFLSKRRNELKYRKNILIYCLFFIINFLVSFVNKIFTNQKLIKFTPYLVWTHFGFVTLNILDKLCKIESKTTLSHYEMEEIGKKNIFN